MKLKAVSIASLIIIAGSFAAYAESIGDKEAAAINGNVFAKLDKDGDGKLDASEFHALVKHHVSKADKNGDGVVDDEELGAMEANALIQLKEF